MDVSGTLVAQQALLRQAVSLSVIKQSADMQKTLADMVSQSVQAISAAESRGSNLDFLA